MVVIGQGVGTGLVFDGQVYHGVAGAAGEFGHMIIGKGAPVACAAGSYECWEAFASEVATLARYAQRADNTNSSNLISFSQLVDRGLDGEKDAQAALLETARYLGLGISNLLKGLSPEAVIVGGRIARAWPVIEEEIKNAVRKNNICRGLPSARIIASTLGENPPLMGLPSLVFASKLTTWIRVYNRRR